MEHQIVQMLGQILAPLGDERRETVLEWVRKEIATRSIIAYCYDRSGASWELGQDSPISPGRTVFAMLHWETQKAVTVFTFQQLNVDGQDAVAFFREVIFDPVHATGPVSHEALFDELASFLADDPDEPQPPAAQANGHAQSEGRA